MMNPAIYPSPEEFQPERWLDGDPIRDHYLCSFSKGSRACIGMEYVALAPCLLFQPLDKQLYPYAGSGLSRT